ncbi:hypothetical protein JCM14036_24720 [Desulfotomaculum defluvii]
MAKKRKHHSKRYKVNASVTKKKEFILLQSSSDRVVIPTYIRIKRMKIRGGFQTFVNSSCVHQHVSLPFIADQPNSQSVEINISPDIILDTAKGRGRRKTLGQFVADDCITNSLTNVVTNFCKQPAFENPYPTINGLTPDVIGQKSLVRRRKKPNISFVPEGCHTDIISLPAYHSVSITNEIPRKVYTYIDRPNSPDILGPTYKKRKRRESDITSFVPKSCTVDLEQISSSTKEVEYYDIYSKESERSNSDTVVKVTQETKIFKKSWLLLVVFLMLLLLSSLLCLK